MRTRDIRTNHHDVSCDVCGRTLLRGERSEAFLAGGTRRQVGELCTARAVHEGWIRESGADDMLNDGAGSEGRTRSFIGRLRQRTAARAERADRVDDHALPEDTTPREVMAESRGLGGKPPEPANGGIVYEDAYGPIPVEPVAAVPEGHVETSREPRHVRAVPTNSELKMQRALEVFNASDYPRTVAGVARSLGAPAISVRPLPDRPSVVAITVMWELSWYRFEVDLSDEAGGARRVGQGSELSELTAEEHVANAVADERGAVQLATTASTT